MKKLILLITAIIILSCKSEIKTEPKPFDQLSSLIDNYAKESLNNGNINSIALAIYRDGKYYHNYYGAIDKGAQNPPNDSTHYEIASITKVFAGSLAAKAVLEKKIDLDDDIRIYLDGDYSNLEYENTPITIKNLLTHTIGLKQKTPKGLKNVMSKMNNGDYENSLIDYDINNLLSELKTVELNKKPGTFYNYNSVGPELVAYILQQAYNKPYKKLLEDFLNELDMNNTYLQENKTDNKPVINNYTSQGELAYLGKNPLLGAAYGLVTTLPDLSKFMVFQLESTNPLIKESTRVLFEDDDSTLGYLWQDLGTAKEEGFFYSKTGTSSGVQSGLLLCPDSNYGQIIIINNNSEASSNDWGNLFNTVEKDLIKFPKINLKSILKSEFLKDIDQACIQFDSLNKEEKYFTTSLPIALNSLGYELLYSNRNANKAIEIFEYATLKYPENFNLFDSLGEAYYSIGDNNKALLNYKKSLKLNPENVNAEKYISEIRRIQSQK